MTSSRPSRRPNRRSRPEREIRDISCGKVVFVTRSGADAAAVLLGERHMAWTRAYRCPVGNGWHLTTQARNGRDGDSARRRSTVAVD